MCPRKKNRRKENMETLEIALGVIKICNDGIQNALWFAGSPNEHNRNRMKIMIKGLADRLNTLVLDEM